MTQLVSELTQKLLKEKMLLYPSLFKLTIDFVDNTIYTIYLQ